jgi:hypothetical protein
MSDHDLPMPQLPSISPLEDGLEFGDRPSFLSSPPFPSFSPGEPARSVSPPMVFTEHQLMEPDELVRAYRRIDVPGRGDLCGAYALQGLIYTHCSLLVVSIEMLVYQLRSATAGSIEPQVSNFGYDVIRDVGYIYYGLSIELFHQIRGVYRTTHPPQGMSDGTLATLYLDQVVADYGHYNYQGLPILGSFDEDAMNDFFDENPPRAI